MAVKRLGRKTSVSKVNTRKSTTTKSASRRKNTPVPAKRAIAPSGYGKFLIELGVGFAFLGRQFQIEVEGGDFYLDLLFYHVRLRCYVVIEFKMGSFKPEHVGKMGFYLSAVDAQLKHADDQPTIGVLLCQGGKKLKVEYALRATNKPIGVSDWSTKMVSDLPKKLQRMLPSTTDIEEELKKPKPRKRK